MFWKLLPSSLLCFHVHGWRASQGLVCICQCPFSVVAPGPGLSVLHFPIASNHLECAMCTHAHAHAHLAIGTTAAAVDYRAACSACAQTCSRA